MCSGMARGQMWRTYAFTLYFIKKSKLLTKYKEVQQFNEYLYYISEDYCYPNPCLNGGLCVPVSNSTDTLCECQDGYFGEHCELSKLMRFTNIMQFRP